MKTAPHRLGSPVARRMAAALAALAVSTALPAPGAMVITGIELRGTDAILSLAPDPDAYYLVEWSTDMMEYQDLVMALGDPAPRLAYRVLPMYPRLFFRGTSLNLYAPGDRDADGIDDVYELKNFWLDPLDPTDADEDSDGDGRTNLQEYRELLGLDEEPPDSYSREVSLYNAEGGPSQTAVPEVHSREVSLRNGDPE